MATKKKPAKKKAAKKATTDKQMFQTDDPIIIKPGGSLLLECDKRFNKSHTPSSPKSKGHKHPNATHLVEIVILDKDGNAIDSIPITDPEYGVAICYYTLNGCDCPEVED